MIEFGRVDFVQEVKDKEIKRYNNHKVSKSDKRCLIVARKIDDFHIARSLDISVTELNHGGVYQ